MCVESQSDISVGEHTYRWPSQVSEEAKQAKAAKAKAARALQAEQRDQAMIALSERRYKLLGKDIRRECMEQQEAHRLAVNCGHM
jgi:hypothetical protein